MGQEIDAMQASLAKLTYEIKLVPGEKLHLPQALVESVGAGEWLITIEPVPPTWSHRQVRRHSAFLNGYSPDDEGLYDDYPSR
jgi:hypothetical protein